MASTVSYWILRPVGAAPKERRPVRPVIGFEGRDDLAIRGLPLDDNVKIGEGPRRTPVGAACASRVGGHVGLRCMLDEVVGEELLEDIEVAFACTCSVFRRTTALAASLNALLLIVSS
jgi:hypothetical protein